MSIEVPSLLTRRLPTASTMRTTRKRKFNLISKGAPGLLDLDRDVWGHITEYLTLADLATCKSVCTTLRDASLYSFLFYRRISLQRSKATAQELGSFFRERSEALCRRKRARLTSAGPVLVQDCANVEFHDKIKLLLHDAKAASIDYIDLNTAPLSSTAATPINLKKLAELDAAEHVTNASFCEPRLDDAALRQLARLVGRRCQFIQFRFGSHVTASSLVTISDHMRSLTRLDFGKRFGQHLSVREEVACVLNNLPFLQSLRLETCFLSSTIFRFVAAAALTRSLKELELARCVIIAEQQTRSSPPCSMSRVSLFESRIDVPSMTAMLNQFDVRRLFLSHVSILASEATAPWSSVRSQSVQLLSISIDSIPQPDVLIQKLRPQVLITNGHKCARQTICDVVHALPHTLVDLHMRLPLVNGFDVAYISNRCGATLNSLELQSDVSKSVPLLPFCAFPVLQRLVVSSDRIFNGLDALRIALASPKLRNVVIRPESNPASMSRLYKHIGAASRVMCHSTAALNYHKGLVVMEAEQSTMAILASLQIAGVCQSDLAWIGRTLLSNIKRSVDAFSFKWSPDYMKRSEVDVKAFDAPTLLDVVKSTQRPMPSHIHVKDNDPCFSQRQRPNAQVANFMSICADTNQKVTSFHFLFLFLVCPHMETRVFKTPEAYLVRCLKRLVKASHLDYIRHAMRIYLFAPESSDKDGQSMIQTLSKSMPTQPSAFPLHTLSKEDVVDCILDDIYGYSRRDPSTCKRSIQAQVPSPTTHLKTEEVIKTALFKSTSQTKRVQADYTERPAETTTDRDALDARCLQYFSGSDITVNVDPLQCLAATLRRWNTSFIALDMYSADSMMHKTPTLVHS